MTLFQKRGLQVVTLSVTILLGIGLIAVGAELYCRIANIPYSGEVSPSENGFGRFDPELGWSHIPNFSGTQEVGSAKRRWPMYFDQNGIRIPRPGFELDPSKPSVLFIGCSFTFGHGLPYEESFAGQFGSLPNVPYQVVNLGVDAYGTDQALLALKRYLPQFNAKVVVYTFLEEHISRNGNYDRRILFPEMRFLGTKPLFKLNRRNEPYLVEKPVLYKDYHHSRLLDLLLLRVGGGWLHKYPPYPERLTKALIREMNNYSEAHGAHFLVIQWDTNGRLSRNYLDELKVNVIDVHQDAPPDWEQMTIPGDGHPDARADAHVAQLLSEYFVKAGLMPDSK